MKEQIARQIYRRLLASTNVVIVPHERPDGDAMGAATALAGFLRNHQIPHILWCKTPPPSGLMFLPHARDLRTDPELWRDERFDTIIVVDSGDLKYNGSEEYIAKLDYRHTIINIDHHPTNKNYGDMNLVIPGASSTNEILLGFFLTNSEPVTESMATSLLTGLVTDTGTFTNAGTSARALAAGGDLIRRGANFNLIKNEVITRQSIAGLRLWGLALGRMAHHEPTGIVYTYVTREDLIQCGASEEDGDGIANFMNCLEEGNATLVLKSTADNTVKGSFRTVKDNMDVSALAQLFGGGGHVKAAGFSVAGTIPEVIPFILETVREYEEKKNILPNAKPLQ